MTQISLYYWSFGNLDKIAKEVRNYNLTTHTQKCARTQTCTKPHTQKLKKKKSRSFTVTFIFCQSSTKTERKRKPQRNTLKATWGHKLFHRQLICDSAFQKYLSSVPSSLPLQFQLLLFFKAPTQITYIFIFLIVYHCDAPLFPIYSISSVKKIDKRAPEVSRLLTGKCN